MTDAEFTGADAGQSVPPQEAGAPEAAPEQRIAELEAQLAAATAEAQKHRDDWLRAKAETENVRRRAADDVAKAHKFGVEGFASALLAVKDSLDAALAVQNATVESYREGVELTSRQLDAAFEKFGILPVWPEGEKFDPHRHQAISQVESDAEPNTVVSVLQKGFLINDRILRPALVVVAKPREEPAPTP